MCFLILLLLALCFPFANASIQILGTYDAQQTKGSGTTTIHTVEFQCSDTNRQGNLTIGDYTLDVECVEPVYHWSYSKIYCIPDSIIQHIEQSCIVNDIDGYNANQAAEAAAVEANLASVRTIQSIQSMNRRLLELDPASRRLMQFDAVSIALASAAIYMSTKALDTANAAFTKATAVEDDVRAVQTTLANMTIFNLKVTQSLENSQNSINTLTNATYRLTDSVASVVSAVAATNSYVNKTTAETNSALNLLAKEIYNNQLQVQAEFNYTSQATANALSRTLGQLETLRQRTQTDINQLYSAQETASDQQVGMYSQLWDLFQRTQLRRMLTASFFESVQTVRMNMMPLTTDAGAAPQNGGLLSGANARLPVETVTMNFVTPVAGGGGTVYQIVSNVLTFYYSSEYAIAQNRPVTPIASIYKQFGPEGCARPYVGSGPPDVNPNAPTCNIWVEVEQSYCNAQVTQSAPQFNWTSSNTSNTIPLSACNVAPNTVTTSFTTFKNTTSLFNHINNQICRVQNTGFYQISAQRMSALGYFPWSPQTCNMTYNQMIAYAASGGFTPLATVGALVQASTQLMQVDVSRRALMKYGQPPGGLEYEDIPFVYTPVQFDSNGNPIYDGSGPHECFRAYWTEASRQPVCAYAAVPLASPNRVSKEVLVSVSGPECTGANCYNVGDSDLTVSAPLTSDSTPPQSFIILGDITQAGTIGIWDVPDDQLEFNTNPIANEKKLSYYNFAPSMSATTPDLNTWQANNGYRYSPRGAVVSATTYHFPAQFDYEGYPVCGVPGGLPSPYYLQGNYTYSTNGCYEPFDWSVDVQPQPIGLSQSVGTFSGQLHASCKPTSGARVIYQDYADEARSPRINGTSTSSFQSSYLLSFWYRMQPGVGDQGNITVLSFSNVQFGVDTKGQAFVLRTGVFDSRSTSIGDNGDLRDFLWHQVAWSIALASSSIDITLYIDGQNRGHFVSTYPAIAFPVSVRPLVSGPYASVKQMTLYPAVQSQSVVNNLYACQQAFMNGRCSSQSERIIPARQIVTSNNFVTCASNSILLLSELAFDAVNPIVAAPVLNDNGWAVSFWLRLSNKQAGTLFTLQSRHFSLQVTTSTTALVVVINGQTINSAAIFDEDAHFIVISYNAGAFTVYRDGAAIGPATNAAALSSSLAYTLTVTSYDVFMIKSYSTALFLAQVKDELSCALPSKISIDSYLPPIGYCTYEAGSTQGYCRHPLLCAGHCSAFSSIDVTNGTFTVSSFACDSGWAAPDCLTRCARTDPESGECLETISDFATGLIPNGQWCNILREYKPIANEAEGILSLIPRSWIMSPVQISIPSGTISQTIDVSGCPVTTVQPFADNSMTLTMQNKQTASNDLLIYLLPDSVYRPASGHRAATCTRPCCQPNGQSFTVPGNSVQYYSVPPCGNVTVVVQTADGLTNCSVISGDSVTQAFQSTNSATVPANVQVAITQAQSVNLQNLVRITSSIFLFMTNLMILQANSTVSSDELVTLLAQQREQILTDGFNSSLFASPTQIIPFNIGATAQSLLANSTAQLETATQAIQAVRDLQPALEALAAQAAELANQRNQTLFEISQNLVDLQKAIAISMGITNPGGGSFADIVKTLSNDAVLAAQAASHTAAGVLDAGMSLIPGLGGGGFLSDIAQIIKIVIYIAIIYVVFIVVTSQPVKDAFRSLTATAAKKPAAKGTKTEEEVLAPVSTGGRYKTRFRRGLGVSYTPAADTDST